MPTETIITLWAVAIGLAIGLPLIAVAEWNRRKQAAALPPPPADQVGSDR